MGIIPFLEVLFDREDYTCYSLTPRGVNISWAHYIVGIDDNAAFFSINAMNQEKTRADSSVIKYRNILIEMDKVPLEKQDQHITEIGMPYSTAVYSGSKSIHYIISLETELQDEQIYRSMVKRVYSAVGNNLVDHNCKNPSRFSRLPGHIRSDTGKEQKLLAVKERVSNLILEQWLQGRGVGPEEVWDNLTPEPRSTFKNPSRLYGATKNFLMFGAPRGEWNPRLFKASADLCRCGYTEDEAISELMKITGVLDMFDRRTIESAFKNELSKKNA